MSTFKVKGIYSFMVLVLLAAMLASCAPAAVPATEAPAPAAPEATQPPAAPAEPATAVPPAAVFSRLLKRPDWLLTIHPPAGFWKRSRNVAF